MPLLRYIWPNSCWHKICLSPDGSTLPWMLIQKIMAFNFKIWPKTGFIANYDMVMLRCNRLLTLLSKLKSVPQGCLSMDPVHRCGPWTWVHVCIRPPYYRECLGVCNVWLLWNFLWASYCYIIAPYSHMQTLPNQCLCFLLSSVFSADLSGNSWSLPKVASVCCDLYMSIHFVSFFYFSIYVSCCYNINTENHNKRVCLWYSCKHQLFTDTVSWPSRNVKICEVQIFITKQSCAPREPGCLRWRTFAFGRPDKLTFFI